MSQMYPHVIFESGGIEEFDVDMMEEHDVELTLLDVAVIVNALDSIIYAESKGVDLLMRKLTGVLSESMVVLPHLDWEDRELIASEEEAYAEDDKYEDEDEDEEDDEYEEDDDE
tara:strand:+ start:369 stop:710 length:342 start_codon:yes stop_codon:yes gene_type:complete